MRPNKSLRALLLSLVVAASCILPAGMKPRQVQAAEGKWHLVFQEEFNEPVLDPTKFSDSYLPHWTTVEQSLAHYDLRDGICSLRIDKDGQGPWWKDAGVQKVSSIQTGMRDGLHHFWKTCSITEHHRAISNFETKYGYFELRARIPKDGGLHSAWWMIGTESRPQEAGEIDIFEICGPDIGKDKSRVRVSVHPWQDERLSEQSLNYHVPCDLSEDFHTYGFEWTAEGMKFYFDGELIRQTKQSPNYKMMTLLGIYENNAPLWSGSPDYDSVYPKRFEIDYFRAFKTNEMLAQEAAEQREAQPGENLAPYAIAGAGQDWNRKSPPSYLIDNDAHTALQSVDEPNFPQYLYLDWKEAQRFDSLTLKSSYAQGQAPTNWELEVSADGQGDWQRVAASGDVSWERKDSQIEARRLQFPAVEAKALRVKINSANLDWGHYAINELLVHDSTAGGEALNLAPDATAEWRSEHPDWLIDGQRLVAGQSKIWPQMPSDILLHWPWPVSFNEVQLHCWHALGQAPKEISVEVSTDGQQWRPIVARTGLNWTHEDATLETQTLRFETVEQVRWLRLRIHGAYTRWRHFAINELEVYRR